MQGACDGLEMKREEEILQLDDKRYHAMRLHDVGGLAELLHEACVYTHSNAVCDDKAAYLRKVGDGTYRYRSIALSERRVTIINDTAVVHGRMTAQADVEGELRDIDNFAAAVWVREAGRWALLVYQPTVIPQPKRAISVPRADSVDPSR